MDQNKQNEKVYYAKCKLMMSPSKDAPLESKVFAVSGEPTFVEKKSGQYGDFLAVTLTAVLPDKSVERHFGKELVSEDHKVQFRFNLSKFLMERFEQHTPRWGQDIIFQLYDMKVESFARRNGETGYNVSAKCADFCAIGGIKKADGSDRPPIQIKGLENGAPKSNAPASATPAPTSVQDVMSNLDMDFEDDDELPF